MTLSLLRALLALYLWASSSFHYSRDLFFLCFSYVSGKVLCRCLKRWSIALCLFLPASVALCRFLLSSSLFLRLYTAFSIALFLDFAAFRWIHLAHSFSTSASTPLRHLALLYAFTRSIFRRLPFSRSSTCRSSTEVGSPATKLNESFTLTHPTVATT